MREELLKLCGVIESVVYVNEENDYAVIELCDAEKTLITVVGTVPSPTPGERLNLEGYYTFHKEYGRQFNITSCEKLLPSEEEDILTYLSSRSVKGVGPVTAEKIVRRFGKDTFDVMENHPEWLADIPGITLKKAAAIAEAFREQSDLRDVMMFCKDFMDTNEITRVYKRFGIGAVGIIRENPYILCDGDSAIPFEKTDRIARAFGIAPDDGERLYYGIRYCLTYNANLCGHTCLPYGKLVEAAAHILEVSLDTVGEAVLNCLKEGRLASFDTAEDRFIMTVETDRAERYIVRKLERLCENVYHFAEEDILAMIEKAEVSSAISYAPLQRRALFEALYSGVMIMTGGPGTGKTTVVKAMLGIFTSLGMRTVLCAPTGRAAKRMSEATSEEAKTIHRLLEMERTNTNEIRFNRNERNPIDEKVVIVDEVSMVDLFLMEGLLRALPRNAKLILIGDSNQLPSVGAGNVLADLIGAGTVRTVCLTDIFRQSEESLIVTNAHKIYKGEQPTLSKTDSDFFFLKREREGSIPETVASLITERLPRAYGNDIRDKIQIITPSKKGVGGVETLNNELQSRLNPPAACKKEKTSHGITFREGDRVMQTVNDYEILWERGDTEGQGIFNGDIGTIEVINAHERHMKIRFDDRLALYEFDRLIELDLAYAITVHKSQGSEYPVVIIPVYNCAPMLMTRNLLYTAVTRAKRMVILVGRAELVYRMVENNREILRYTTLEKRLQGQLS